MLRKENRRVHYSFTVGDSEVPKYASFKSISDNGAKRQLRRKLKKLGVTDYKITKVEIGS